MTMNCFSVLFCFALFLLSSQREVANAAQLENNGVHIVYMGAASESSDRDLLLSSLATREKNSVKHSYNNAFSGFAARLSEEEARSIARRPGVVSVFPDPMLVLHTTRSWDFLYQLDREMGMSPRSNSSSHGVDTIIGILDTGIWPESEAFSDKGMGPIPSRWKGTCMAGHAFHPSNCNRKLIGARYYADPQSSSTTARSPRDYDGHGTHVAAIAAGCPVEGASYIGLARGTAKGGSPGSRIAVYRVCDDAYGCRGSDVLKAFDDAIADGVDIISLSMGYSSELAGFAADPIAIGAFHAIEKGVLVVCSAGDGGRKEQNSVANVAPWMLTVGATTVDREFETNVLLGGNKVIKGGAINLVNNIRKSPVYPLISGASAINNSSYPGEASNCDPDSLDENKVRGKIVVCENADWRDYSPEGKLQEITRLGGIGMILLDGNERNAPSVYKSPMTAIGPEDEKKILGYMNSTRNPVATILPTTTAVPADAAAPSVALFSGRGPPYETTNILKPDIVAPGVGILAAWRGNKTEKGRTSQFNILSGTSMACPHVSAIAAIVKSQNPTWSPSALKSAIMTTAIQTNNKKGPIMVNDVAPATPYEFGAGHISASGPSQPGLVYDMETTDYLQYLCYSGYNISTIKLISKSVPETFFCPSNSNINLASNLNYPSISISLLHLLDNKDVKVKRTVTNVGEENSVYRAIVDAPTGLEVKVIPNKLLFTKSKKNLSYTLQFQTRLSSSGELFGSITWTNGKNKVRSPFVFG